MLSDDDGELNSRIEPARLPSLNALRCFDAAAQQESFSGAAAVLHLTPGAVSRAVGLLEEELGFALFERRNRRVFLNEAGRRLARAVRRGFATMEDAVRSLKAAQRDAPLVLSCEPTLLMRWLIPRLPQFEALHPNISLHLVAGCGPVRLDGGVDLAVRRNDFALSQQIHANPLFDERIGAVCRADRVEAYFEADIEGRPAVRVGAPLLHSRNRPDAWETWNRLLGGVVPNGRAQVFDHFYFSLQAAAAGIGVAIGPWQLVRDDIASGILCAPCGFIEDGSRYELLAPGPIEPGHPHAPLLGWLRASGL